MNLNCKQAIFIFILLSTLVTYSQDYSVKQSTEKFNSELWRIIAVSPDAYYTIDRKQSLKKFNSALELQKQVLFDPSGVNNEGSYIYKALLRRDRIFIFYRTYDLDTELLEIKYTVYDLNLIRLAADVVLTSFTCQSQAFMDNYSIHFSPDLNKIGILQPSKNKVRIAVIDENMNKSNPVEFAMDFVVNNADLRNAVISDSGDVCLVASGDQEEDDVSLPNKYLIVFRQDGEELIYNLQLDPGKSILSCGIDFRDHQTLTCSGFYCEDSTTLVRGAFNITYHLGQQEILSKQSYAISNPAYTDYQTLINEASKFETEKKRIKYLEKIASGNYGMGNEINTRSIPCSDGGTIILGEEFDFRNTIEYPTANIEGIGDMPEFYSYWVLKRIFVLKFGPEGNLQWQNIIDRKKFIGPPITNLNTIHFNDIYAYNEKSGKFYFVYDENENRKVNSTRLIIFNLANGNYIETELFSSKINGFNQFNFPVKFTTDVAEKGFVFISPDNSKETIGKITF